jgi:hypothetical protein
MKKKITKKTKSSIFDIDDSGDEDLEQQLTRIRSTTTAANLPKKKRPQIRGAPSDDEIESLSSTIEAITPVAKKTKSTSHQHNITDTSTGGNGGRGTRLNKVQRRNLLMWLEAYRKKWNNYWNWISDDCINQLADCIPVTRDELLGMDRITEDKVSKIGVELIATIYSFLEANNMLNQFPEARPPPASLKVSPLWQDPMSDEAEDARQQSGGGGGGGAQHAGGGGSTSAVKQEKFYSEHFHRVPAPENSQPPNITDFLHNRY